MRRLYSPVWGETALSTFEGVMTFGGVSFEGVTTVSGMGEYKEEENC